MRTARLGRRHILGADVDSTVWDLSAWVREAVLDVTGEPLDLEAVATWTHVLDAYGESAAMEIYTRVFSPHSVREREPYPGAMEALRRLQEERGIQIPFPIHTYEGSKVPCSAD